MNAAESMLSTDRVHVFVDDTIIFAGIEYNAVKKLDIYFQTDGSSFHLLQELSYLCLGDYYFRCFVP